MGNYLPNPQQSFVSATTPELQEALTRMGPLFQVYSPLLSQHGLSGASFNKALKRPALFKDLFDQVGIGNPLHRIVLEARIRNHHAKNIVVATAHCAAVIPLSTTEEHFCDSDSPQDLVHLLSSIEVDNKEDDKEQSNNYATLYSQGVVDNCLSIDILAKLRKLDQWNVVFEALGVTNIMHQNILYNRILDVAKERNGKLQQQQDIMVKTAPTLKEEGSVTEEADDKPIYEATRKGVRNRQQHQRMVTTKSATLDEEGNESEKAEVEPIYEASSEGMTKPQMPVSDGDMGQGDSMMTALEEVKSETADDKPIYKPTRKEATKRQTYVSGGDLGQGGMMTTKLEEVKSEMADDKPIYDEKRKEATKRQTSVAGDGLGRGKAQMRGTSNSSRTSRAYISFKGDSDGRY